MNEVRTVGETFMYSLQSLFAFLPSLLGAILLLIVGWFVAKLVAKLIEKGLHAIGFDRAADRSGLGKFVRRSGSGRSTSQVVGQLGKWFTFLLFVQAAASIMAMPQLTNVINSIILFIPNVIVAVAIIVVASVIADFLSGLVRASVSEMGVSKPEMLARLTKYAIVGLGVIAAVNQLGIATTVVNTLFIALVGTIALALALAFGLGGREVAGRIAESWYERGRDTAARVREGADQVPSGQIRVESRRDRDAA